eukprot:7289675-Prymnesium_polylepis.1
MLSWFLKHRRSSLKSSSVKSCSKPYSGEDRDDDTASDVSSIAVENETTGAEALGDAAEIASQEQPEPLAT